MGTIGTDNIYGTDDLYLNFQGDRDTTRAETVQTLYNMVSDKIAPVMPFDDVDRAWYADAVYWWYRNGIVSGVGNGKFAPNDCVTREQFITMLYRFTDFYGIDTAQRKELTAFMDTDDVSAFAEEAMIWAVAEGYMNGRVKEDGLYLDPKANITRAEVASVIMCYDRANNVK